MIVSITQSHLTPSQLAFLQLLNSDDVILCRADGVYACAGLIQSEVRPRCLALQDDCLSRGITSAQSVTMAELIQLQATHQQWITL
ncbi:DsrH/TusB family sulfur metabolism protein [Alteromonas gilva]|uniref:DsrH/TusB family sulfur metabolism protein n=1 Tax=Alteromonas gilva TaxID=2987522 RepID=A0ABT5L266_9ALTE|nr:DsrH/TusB family sulfur metabolism protein [Alteromonas gilva]MDC8831130.1 DsrH/TusB family sulfur metabolism protein [Alteromonas gilva]